VLDFLSGFLLTLLRCFAHIINLSCKEMLDAAAQDGFTQIKRLREVIAYASFLFFFQYLFIADIVIDSPFITKA
jgi:hypothetical protein